jgi:hypothetical protein
MQWIGPTQLSLRCCIHACVFYHLVCRCSNVQHAAVGPRHAKSKSCPVSLGSTALPIHLLCEFMHTMCEMLTLRPAPCPCPAWLQLPAWRCTEHATRHANMRMRGRFRGLWSTTVHLHLAGKHGWLQSRGIFTSGLLYQHARRPCGDCQTYDKGVGMCQQDTMWLPESARHVCCVVLSQA